MAQRRPPTGGPQRADAARTPIAFSGAPYVPGRTARPAEECFEPLKAAISSDMTPDALARSAAFRVGLEAFAQGYYWEAHELLEAVWMCLPPACAERQLLRGLIQLANGGLKARMGRAAAVARILGLAEAALAEAYLNDPGPLMGLARDDLAGMLDQVAGEGAERDVAK